MVSSILICPERYCSQNTDLSQAQTTIQNGFRDSYVEGWHNILKYGILNGQNNIWPQKFTKQVRASLEGRAREYYFNIVGVDLIDSSNQNEISLPHDEILQEQDMQNKDDCVLEENENHIQPSVPSQPLSN